MDAVVFTAIGVRVLFEDFYESEHDHVFRATLAFCGDREVARDATQEAFARAYSRWRRLRKHDWAADG